MRFSRKCPPPESGCLDALQQVGLRFVAVATNQVDVNASAHQPTQLALLDANRNERALVTQRIEYQRGVELRTSVVGLEVIVGEHGNHLRAAVECAAHLLHEVLTGNKVPLLQHAGVTVLFERPGNPLRPVLIHARVADEEVLGNAHGENMHQQRREEQREKGVKNSVKNSVKKSVKTSVKKSVEERVKNKSGEKCEQA